MNDADGIADGYVPVQRYLSGDRWKRETADGGCGGVKRGWRSKKAAEIPEGRRDEDCSEVGEGEMMGWESARWHDSRCLGGRVSERVPRARQAGEWQNTQTHTSSTHGQETEGELNQMHE